MGVKSWWDDAIKIMGLIIFLKCSMFKVLLMLLGLCCVFSTGIASWEGPVEVLSGKWGVGEQEFKMESDGINYLFPRLMDVSSEGDIAIADLYNARIKIYSSGGSIFILGTERIWSYGVTFVGVNIAAIVSTKGGGENAKKKLIFYSGEGSLLVIPEQPENVYLIRNVGEKLYAAGEGGIWYVYDFQGEVLSVQKKRPEKIGYADYFTASSSLGQGYTRVQVEYPEYSWNILTRRSIYSKWDYYQDGSGFLYSQAYGIRYNACGKEMGTVSAENQYETFERDTPPY